MKKEQSITILAIIVIWWITSYLINRSFLLPTPLETLKYFGELFLSRSFYEAILSTIARVTIGFITSLSVALLVSILANEFPTFKRFFEPIHVLTKTIPNISYMIIALIWFGSEGSVALISFMILFPVFFNGFMNALNEEDEVLKKVQLIYPESFLEKARRKLLPQLLNEVLNTGKTAASLGFKVGVMAEILGSVNVGIGRQISYCKTQLNMAGIFAWTIIIILICLLFDYIFNQIYQYRLKEENGWKN